jgi:cobalt/nickel transport system ATP-binding protein
MTDAGLLIALKDVAVMRGGRPVLDRVSLTLHRGERLAVVGPNGAGKTTLLRTIIGLNLPDAGAISIFGQPRQAEKDFHEVRAKVGFLFQDPDDQLFCPTVVEDVAFGPMNLGLPDNAAIAKAREILALMELSGLADRVTYRLSGGEKRLVSLAGVLAMDPEALLLDEPTNGLDRDHYARLVAILKTLPTAMIVVSHDTSFLAELATRALVLQEGRLLDGVIHRHPHMHDHVHIHAAQV